MKNNLPVTEELDFHYLLALMAPLRVVPEFQWLPELFSIIGYESLIVLCRFAGGETIKIPTIEELSDSIEALQCFYDLQIKQRIKKNEIPEKLSGLVEKIQEVYNAGND